MPCAQFVLKLQTRVDLHVAIIILNNQSWGHSRTPLEALNPTRKPFAVAATWQSEQRSHAIAYAHIMTCEYSFDCIAAVKVVWHGRLRRSQFRVHPC